MNSVKTIIIAIASSCFLLAVNAVCAQTSTKVSPAQLLPNTSFADNAKGWALQEASVLSSINSTGQLIQLNAVPTGGESWSHAGVKLRSIPTSKKLKFSCLLRSSEPTERLTVNAFAYDKNDKMINNWSSDAPVEKSNWRPFNTSYALPPDAKSFAIWVINRTGKKAFFFRPSLTVGEAVTYSPKVVNQVSTISAQETKVILARYKACVAPRNHAESGVITFPIPGLYREQIPLTFNVTTEPTAALIGYKISKREDGINWICEVNLKTPEEGVIINWEALVLVQGRVEPALPKATASAPSTVTQWTRSTLCAQSDDPDIRLKARHLASGTSDVEAYVRKVIAFTSTNKGTGVKFDALDAKKALVCGGSCTSRANLAAALLRAQGIPARTLSHLPTWFKGKMFEHWLVEYFHPNVGWVWVESTLGKFQQPPNSLVVLAVSSADDEDKAEDPIHLRYIMHGAPYLSGCELSKNLVASNRLANADGPNDAIDEGSITGNSADLKLLLQAANSNFQRLSNQTGISSQSNSRTESIRAAVHSGSAEKLAAELNRR